MTTIRLSEIAHARSGDKGNHANVGVIAFTTTGFEFLGRELTSERVAAFFEPLAPSRVERFALPGIKAYNFVLFDVLDGGAGRSLRLDSQGKTLGVAILEMQLSVPENLETMWALASREHTAGKRERITANGEPSSTGKTP